MKNLPRLLLLAAALAMGGGLGHLLLPDHSFLFIAVCFALGELFYRVDSRLNH